jgi:hypothetical protein
MSINNLLGEPYFIEGIGDVHPVKLIDWDKFEKNASPLLLTKDHLVTENDDEPLLDRLILGLRDENIVNSLCTIFNIALKSEKITFIYDGFRCFFSNENKQFIDSDNYEKIRDIIIQQNILIVPKVYKNKEVQKWAERVLVARGKNAPNITMEEMLSTVSVFTGKHYWDLKDYTIYQLRSDFNRICKIKEYESQSMLFANPYADLSKFKMEHFAEKIDMYRNPYDDVFKDKGQMKKIL